MTPTQRAYTLQAAYGSQAAKVAEQRANDTDPETEAGEYWREVADLLEVLEDRE